MILRTDLAVLLMCIAVFWDRDFAIALAIAVVAHELGHFVVARLLGADVTLILQVGGGRPYLKGLVGVAPMVAVLLAGPVAGLVPFTASLYMEYFGAKTRNAVVLWTLYQLIPFPTLDGGQLLAATALARVPRALTRSRILWGLAAATVLLLGWRLPGLVQYLGVGSVMAVLLARSEAGPTRYADAYEAWEAGDHLAVLARTERIPRYLNEEDAQALALLGLASARAIDKADAMENLVQWLAPYHPERVRAAEYLLRQGYAEGGILARMAFDALDKGRITEHEMDSELWADLAFYYASAEAERGRRDVALNLLERAEALGFDHVERLEADPQLGSLKDLPRFRAVFERMRTGATPDLEAG